MTWKFGLAALCLLCLSAAVTGGRAAAQTDAAVPTAENAPVEWRYATGASPTGWEQPGFDDAGWKRGAAPFGAARAGVRTPWAETPGDIYLRRTVTLRRALAQPCVLLLHDDEAEVYVDGVLACRASGANASYDWLPVRPDAAARLTAGTHTLAVHCHQISGPQFIDVGIVSLGATAAGKTPTRDVFADTWAATDALGRSVTMGSLPMGGGLRADRTVGVFYFLANDPVDAPVYDITRILAANPTHPAYGPPGSGAWWGQPWFGYYRSSDPAVIRKHLQMLADAGVDVIVFDNTNGPTYANVYLTICRVMEQMRSEGNRTPQLAFFAGHDAWNTLLNDFYAPNLFPDLWFRWKGKPLMLVHQEAGGVLPDTIKNFFSIRESWAWTQNQPWFGSGRDAWPWLDNYPQNYGWHESPDKPEETVVQVAQHATTSIGRSSVSQREPPVDDLRLTPQTPLGLCFAQSADRALKIDPEFIFVTGWNEWTAGHFTQDSDGSLAGKPNPKGAAIFVDEYNEEFSRDIEPEQGRLGDNYLYQFVDFVRRYKGARAVPPVSRKTIPLTVAGLRAWAGVQPEFRDAIGDPVQRDYTGWGGIRYTNHTGRNDIVAAKVSCDAVNIYFYVRTGDALTPHDGKSWMLLYLNVDGDAKTGWLGYDYVIDRRVGNQTTSLEHNVGGKYAWESAGQVRYVTHGNELMIAVPRALLNLPAGKAATIDFKWADNIAQTGDISDFTLNGDAAPNDRFNYRARLD